MPQRHAKTHKHAPAEQDASQGEPRTDATQEQSEVEKLRMLVDQMALERDQLREQLLRSAADFQNFRRRMDQQMRDNRQYATEKLVTELLPVLDNFERTISAVEGGATLQALMDGVKAIDRQFRSVLESQQLSRIPAIGHPLDTDFHEAIATEDSEEHEEGTITAELEAGYKMGDKVIRPARVRVAKKP